MSVSMPDSVWRSRRDLAILGAPNDIVPQTTFIIVCVDISFSKRHKATARMYLMIYCFGFKGRAVLPGAW
jgi:hypothetical protein